MACIVKFDSQISDDTIWCVLEDRNSKDNNGGLHVPTHKK